MTGESYVKQTKENYDLEVGKIIKEISKTKAERILLQFPDGLKPLAVGVVNILRKKFPEKEFFIWGGSCFGACDVPILSRGFLSKPKKISKKFSGPRKSKDFLGKGSELLIQFGHREMKEKKNKNEI